MEEILASIRRIISEDETEGEEGAMQSETVEEVEEEEEEALELTQMVEDDGTVVQLNAETETAAEEHEAEPEEEAIEPELPGVDEVEVEQEVELEAEAEEASETALEFEAEEEPDAEPVALELDDGPQDEPDVSPEPVADSQVAAFEAPAQAVDRDGLVSQATALAATAAMSNLTRLAIDEQETTPPAVSDLTVVALARQAIEPYLKAWLDENLAPLVERVVREEVKKMARRAEDR